MPRACLRKEKTMMIRVKQVIVRTIANRLLAVIDGDFCHIWRGFNG